MSDIAFSCRCGAVRGTVSGLDPASGTHAVCYCDSCRAAELYLRQPDPEDAGVHIFQTEPDRLTFDAGRELVAPMSFTGKGALRWRATCCDTPMFNTARTPKISFVGIRTPILSDPSACGPVTGWAFVPGKDGKTRHRGLYALAVKGGMRMLMQRLSGRWKNTPFFDVETGKPLQPVDVLPKGLRKELLATANT